MSQMDATPKQTLAWRFTTGKVKSNDTDVVHLQLDVQQPQPITTGRLAIDPEQADAYKVDDSIELFVCGPGQEDETKQLRFWHVADGAMADPKQNPWSSGQVRKGDIVEGLVIRYVADYAVIVALRQNLTQELTWQGLKDFTAFLHIKQLPDALLTPKIQNLLHVGDCVQGMIDDVNEEELHISISVNEWLSLYQQQCQQKINSAEHIGRNLVSATSPPNKRQEKTLLVIDDDDQFCRDMQKVLSYWQVKLRYCHDLTGLEQELKQNRFDGILLDCDLGSANKERPQIEQLLRAQAKQARLAAISSNSKQMNDSPLPLLAKPLNIPQVLAWLDSGQITPVQQEQHHLYFSNSDRRWQIKGGEGFVIQRAEILLAECCRHIDAQQALWVKEERPGYYAIRVSHGIASSMCRQLETTLQNSYIANAIDSQKPQQIVDHKSGPLQEHLGSFGHAYILPSSSSGIYDRAIAFFSHVRLNLAAKEFLQQQLGHFEDLTYLMDASLILENNETFASQGLLLASTLHEIRTAASTVAGISQRLQERMSLPLPRLREEVGDMEQAAQRLLDLCERGLDRVRPHQNHIQDLEQLVGETLRLMRGRMHSEGSKAELCPLHSSLSDTLSLPYPAKYVEIPLTNLLDNALQHCAARDWAKVQVSLSLDPGYPNKPLLIIIEDSGLGMSDEQRRQLFSPRSTSRGRAGCGMGLFLSKQLLSSIGGEIELVKTVRWIGSRFHIRLPVTG